MNDYEKDISIIEAATPGFRSIHLDAFGEIVIELGGTFCHFSNDDAVFYDHFNHVKVRELVDGNRRKDERIAELERALRRSLDVFKLTRMEGQRLPHWHEKAEELLK